MTLEEIFEKFALAIYQHDKDGEIGEAENYEEMRNRYIQAVKDRVREKQLSVGEIYNILCADNSVEIKKAKAIHTEMEKAVEKL